MFHTEMNFQDNENKKIIKLTSCKDAFEAQLF